MTAAARSAAARLAVGLVAALLAGAAPPMSRAPSWETRSVLTLAGALTLTHRGRTTTRPVSDGFAETRRVTVLAPGAGTPTKVSVTYDAVHRRITAPGVPPEVAGRTFVVAKGDAAHPAGQVTEGGKKVKAYLAAEIAHDLRDLFVPNPFVAAARALAARPGAKVPLQTGVVERLLDLGAHTRVTKATLRLRRALSGRALLHLEAHLETTVGDTRVTGILAGPVVVDTHAGRLSWLRLAGDLAGQGAVTLDLGAGGHGAKGGKAHAAGPRKRAHPVKVRARARVKVRIGFSLARTWR